MTIRPPRALARKLPDDDPLSASLEHEILAEKAATYGRLLKRLEAALAALDGVTQNQQARSGAAATGTKENQARRAAAASGTHRNQAKRAEAAGGPAEDLLDAAGEALWHVVIQRDLCGFRNTEAFLRDMKVPAAVRLRMGVARARGS